MRSRLIAKLRNELALLLSDLSPNTSPVQVWESVGKVITSLDQYPVYHGDRLAHEVVYSALKAATTAPKASEILHFLLETTFETIYTLFGKIAKGDDIEALTETWLPTLIGMLKALAGSCLPLSSETFAMSWNYLQKLMDETLVDQLSEILNKLSVDPDLSSYRRRLSRNSYDRHPFSAELLQTRCITFLRNSLAVHIFHSLPSMKMPPTSLNSKFEPNGTPISATFLPTPFQLLPNLTTLPYSAPSAEPLQFNKLWSSLTKAKTIAALNASCFPVDVLNAFANIALKNLSSTMKEFDSNSSIPNLILYLQASSLAWALSSLPLDPLLKTIFNVFSLTFGSSIDCLPLLETAALCLALISAMSSCPSPTKLKIHNFALDLLTVPHPAFSRSLSTSVTNFTLALSQVLATTSYLLPQSTSSSLYSLIRNASGNISQIKFENCCTALAVLACDLQTPSILDTVVPFFMRTLSSNPNLTSVSSSIVPSTSSASISSSASTTTDAKSESNLPEPSITSPASSSSSSLPISATSSLRKMSFSAFDTSSCFRHLVTIALDAPLKNFLEIAPFFSEYTRSHLGNGPVSELIVESIYRMEQHASSTKKRVVLHMLLSFFIDKAAYQLIQNKTNVEELGKLLQLISKVCGMIESQKRHSILEALSTTDEESNYTDSISSPQSKPNSDLTNREAISSGEKLRLKLTTTQRSVSSKLNTPNTSSFLPLFRSLWYFIVIFDMLSKENMLDTVVDIAAQTPRLPFTLIPENYFQSPSHKARLMQLLPSSAPLIQPLTTEESLYLLTQYHIMCCTASDAELHVFSHLDHMVQYKSMFPVFIPLVELVMTQFFFHKKASKQLSTMVRQLLDGVVYPHPQIASTCTSLLSKLFQKHTYLLYSKDSFGMTLECALSAPENPISEGLKKWIQTARTNSIAVSLSNYLIENEGFPVSMFLSSLSSPPRLLDTFHWTLCKLSKSMGQRDMLTSEQILNQVKHYPDSSSLFTIVTFLTKQSSLDQILLRYLVSLPFTQFSKDFIKTAVIAWHALIYNDHTSETPFLILLERYWQQYLIGKLGLYNTKFPIIDPLRDKVEYAGHQSISSVNLLNELECMCFLIEFLEDLLVTSEELPDIYFQLLGSSLCHEKMTSHGASRTARFLLLSLALQAALHDSCGSAQAKYLKEQAFVCAIKWFAVTPQLACQSPHIMLDAIKKFSGLAQKIFPSIYPSEYPLLILLLANESEQIRCWCDLEASMDIPLSQPSFNSAYWKNMVKIAFQYHPGIAIHLITRFPAHMTYIQPELQNHVKQNAHSCELHSCPSAVFYLLCEENINTDVDELLHLTYWDPLPPIQAMTLFQSKYKYHPLVLQYAFRSLFSVPIKSVLFYIPQLVQLLRHDPLGYVMEYILHAAKTSPIFAHQIIWNMKANMYHDEAGTEPDPLMPLFEELIEKIIHSFTPEALSYYHREFDFFNKITSISGKLKPFIKKSKPEKKKKIDEELALIQVDVGCYLPSNPESTVIDIDYSSGRPLQSHAKAPFLATFKIEREVDGMKEQVWQSAIFKVGDDCRQDVLALQLIALFKSIFKSVSLDLYLFPYRVVATAPGCGVIEVIPNAISRDMLGREKINSLFDYFVSKYGLPHTSKFRKAQMNFIQSVAGYSVIVYLLQIKDRHNGNIMLDDQGHIIHIDFGFILDISPGGVNFESSPFKLTSEMLQVIQPVGSELFNLFRQLMVKAFLAVRPYAEEIVNLVQLMAESGLPCFKGEQTLKKLRSRFVLDRTQKEAASYITDRINDSYKNWRTVAYDKYQNLQSGIPY